MPLLTGQPVFIKSHDNDLVALNSPDSKTVQLATLPSTDTWNTAATQWVITPVLPNAPVDQQVYQVALFSSQGTLYLTAGGSAPKGKVSVDALSTKAPNMQLWNITQYQDDQYWFTPTNATTVDLGFEGTLPVNGTTVELVPPHDSQNTGDRFTVHAVAYPGA